MKRALALAALILWLLAGCAAERQNKVTLTLGDDWVSVALENNTRAVSLHVANYTTSAYTAQVRVVSRDHAEVLAAAVTVEAGYSADLGPIPAGGYVLQARSADGVKRSYTLGYES